jgi:hypothetical protein
MGNGSFVISDAITSFWIETLHELKYNQLPLHLAYTRDRYI